MNDQLQVIKDAMDVETNGGMDLPRARQLADEFVAANPALFVEYQTKSTLELTSAVDVFRAAGMEDEQYKIEIWLLHHFEPQEIGGPVEATIRIAPAQEEV